MKLSLSTLQLVSEPKDSQLGQLDCIAIGMTTKARTVAALEEEVRSDLALITDRILQSETVHQELGARVERMEEKLADTSQNMEQMMKMMQTMLDRQSLEFGDTSGSANRRPGKERVRNPDPTRIRVEEVFPEQPVIKEGKHGDHQGSYPRVNMPRVDFPSFNGEDPIEWVEEAEFYFEMYQTPEMYKSRMASMSFMGDAREWYRSFKIANPFPPWPILVDEVLSFFSNSRGKPIDEFKRVHQVGKVEEYIRAFLKAKTRLFCKTQIDHEEFYLGCFISGLKEEIKNTIDLFDPSTLNQAFDYARKIETTLEGAAKRNSYHSKPPFSSQPKLLKYNEGGAPKWSEGQNQSNRKTGNPLTIEQKKALGLCFRCNEKYHVGHKCSGRGLHAIQADSSETESEEEGPVEPIVEEAEEEHAGNGEEEQGIITMCTPNSKNSRNYTIIIKGRVEQVPVCCFIDSGSTHSFIHPAIVQILQLKPILTTPLAVRIANGTKMVTNTLCKGLKFQMQGNYFEADLRVMAIPGQDILLGADWLSEFGKMEMDWQKGTVAMQHKGKRVELAQEEVVAQVHICEGTVNPKQEKKRGNQVIFAHLFFVAQIEQGEPTTIDKQPAMSHWPIVHPDIEPVLKEFEDLFAEPTE